MVLAYQESGRTGARIRTAEVSGFQDLGGTGGSWGGLGDWRARMPIAKWSGRC